MSISITLQQALGIWEKNNLTPESLWPHLDDAELDLAAQDDPEKREQVIDHLSRCRLCADRYRMLQSDSDARPTTGIWDVAILRAAAGEDQTFPITYASEKRLYRIEIMRNSAGGEDGLAVLAIIDPQIASQHEGMELWVCDSQGQNILRGIVVRGEVWQKINNLNEFDYRELLVYVADQAEPTPLNK